MKNLKCDAKGICINHLGIIKVSAIHHIYPLFLKSLYVSELDVLICRF